MCRAAETWWTGSSEPLQGRRSLVARLATNSLALAAGTVVASGISFFTFVAVTRNLGRAAYGDLAAALVYLFIPAVLADVGLTATIVRRISADPEATEPAIGASIPLRVLVSLGITTVFLAAAFVLPFDHRVRVAVLISSLGTLATLFTSIFTPIFQARLAMQWPVSANIAGRVVTLGLTYAAIAAGLGFKSLVWAAVFGQVFTLFMTAALALGVMHVRLRPRIDLPYWGVLLRGGIVLGAAVAVGQLYFRVDTVVLSLLRSSREVGLYGASYKFLELAVVGPYAILISLFPTMSRFLESERHRVRPLAQNAFDIGLVVSVPLTVLAIAFARDIITFTSGERYAGGAVALQLLAPYIVATFLLTPALALLLAAGANRLLLAVNVSLLVLNIALNFALIPFYGYKVAALISTATEIVDCILLTAVAHRVVGFRPNARAVPVVAGATAAMVLVIVVVPAAVVPLALLALAVYAAIVVVSPGAVREVVLRLAGRAPA